MGPCKGAGITGDSPLVCEVSQAVICDMESRAEVETEAAYGELVLSAVSEGLLRLGNTATGGVE